MRQGRVSGSPILCEIFVLSLFGVFEDLHRYTLGCAFAHLHLCTHPWPLTKQLNALALAADHAAADAPAKKKAQVELRSEEYT